jgi:DNA mismatch repair protein MutL
MDTKYSRNFQRIFVNKRIVSDKIVSAAIRNAYKELIPPGRFAIAVIFIEIDPFHVDSNVSPTKSEVRFRDGAYIQKFLTNAIKKHLAEFDRVAVNLDFSRVVPFTEIRSPKELARMVPIISKGSERIVNAPIPQQEEDEVVIFDSAGDYTVRNTNGSTRVTQPIPEAARADVAEKLQEIQNYDQLIDKDNENFFGEPIAQIFDTYIVAKAIDGLIIIDQHAVHEKIVQEKIVRNLNSNNKQYITKPELIELSVAQLEVASAIIAHINACGFQAELVQKSLLISAIPTVLDSDEAFRFIHDALEDRANIDGTNVVSIMKRRIAGIACHNSIRAGRRLSFGEMRELMQQMMKTKTIHQCNHHRPSFIKISKKQLDKIFDR